MNLIKWIINKILRPIIRFLLNNPIVKIFLYEIKGYPPALYERTNLSCKEQIYEKIMRYIKNNGIEGDYLEFGVYKGNSFIIAYNFAEAFKINSMNFYAFDSFQGLPDNIGSIRDEVGFSVKGDFFCDINEFKKNLFYAGINLKKVKIMQGWYDESLNEETKKKLSIKKAAVIMVDCDLYKSTVPVLNFIIDYLQDGTVIMFDDWFCYKGNPYMGEQGAFREWLKNNLLIKATEFHKYCAQGNSFIIQLDSD